MIDFHCHLDLYPNPGSVVEEIVRRGTYVLAVTTTPRAWEGNLALVEGANRIRVAPGLHPELVPERHSELPLLLDLIGKSRYVGEIGIDGSPPLKKHLPLQERIFSDCLAACARWRGRIISIHSRGAATRVLDVIERHPDAGTPVLHWFSGTKTELARATALGCWFSVGPGMLRSRKGCDLAKLMPHDRVLTESDGPFVQDRGAPVMPYNLDRATAELAECWHRSAVDTAAQLTTNFKSISSRALMYETAT